MGTYSTPQLMREWNPGCKRQRRHILLLADPRLWAPHCGSCSVSKGMQESSSTTAFSQMAILS